MQRKRLTGRCVIITKMIHEKEALEKINIKKDSMDKSLSSIIIGGLFFVIIGYFLFSVLKAADSSFWSQLTVLNTVFISILMQAFPFMLIGVLVSSAMHVFIADEFIVKMFPTKYGLGFFTAMFAGLFFPVCECAIVPVMSRLVKKGVALPIAVTFMLSAPIINPIVIISTLYAFPGQPKVMLMRVYFGLIIALTTGLALFFFGNKKTVLLSPHDKEELACSCCNKELTHSSCKNETYVKKRTAAKIRALFIHTGEEFFAVGKYLILGAFITSLIQTFVPKEMFTNPGGENGLSLLIMMTMAFLFSVCSTSDAFIARSFSNQFSMGSILGFLVFGPMMDVKNMLMLLANFKKCFVIKLSVLIFVLNFIVLYFGILNILRI